VSERCDWCDQEETSLIDVVAFCSMLVEILIGRSVVAQISQDNGFEIEPRMASQQ
jgi:hypothetical protein